MRIWHSIHPAIDWSQFSNEKVVTWTSKKVETEIYCLFLSLSPSYTAIISGSPCPHSKNNNKIIKAEVAQISSLLSKAHIHSFLFCNLSWLLGPILLFFQLLFHILAGTCSIALTTGFFFSSNQIVESLILTTNTKCL